MRRALRWLGLLVALLGVGALGWIFYHWTVLSTFPQMPSAYEAKEMCSCLWVEQRSTAYCEQWVRQSVVPSQGREVDEAARTVTARALWQTTTARYLGEREGCRAD